MYNYIPPLLVKIISGTMVGMQGWFTLEVWDYTELLCMHVRYASFDLLHFTVLPLHGTCFSYNSKLLVILVL